MPRFLFTLALLFLVTGLGPAPVDSPPLEVQVVFARSGRPAPKAQVFHLRSAALDDRARGLQQVGIGIDEAFEVLGESHTADARGRVHLDGAQPGDGVRARLLVRGRLRTAHLVLPRPPAEGPLRLELETAQGFSVRVVDEHGEPVVAAPVELVLGEEEGLRPPPAPDGAFAFRRYDASHGRDELVQAGRTDDRGHAFLALPPAPDDLPTFLADRATFVAEQVAEGARPWVLLGGLQVQKPMARVDWDEPDEEAVELQAPALARVEVSLTTTAGFAPPPGELVLTTPGKTLEELRVPGVLVLARTMRQDPGEERWTFWGIEQGMDLRLIYLPEGLGYGMQFEGSVESGRAYMHRSLDLGGEYQALRGRALGPGGEPMRLADLTFEELGGDGGHGIGRVRTDADGHFELYAPWYCGGDFQVRTQLSDGAPLRAVLPRVDGLAYGEEPADVGELPFEPKRLLLAGRVIDERGQAVRADLRLVNLSMGARLVCKPRGGKDGKPFVLGGHLGYGPWTWFTDAEGGFRFEGWASGQNVRLEVVTEGLRILGPDRFSLETSGIDVVVSSAPENE